MFVLGIDPGLTTTGYGVVGRFPALKPVAAGVIRTRVEDTVAVRLRDLYDSLLSLIEEHGPFEIHGDPELMRPLDALLASFVQQRRMKIAGDYQPCYRVVT